jgi:hypothetical protein
MGAAYRLNEGRTDPRRPPATSAVQVAGPQEDVPDERIEQLGIEVQRAAFAVARRRA